MNREDLDFIQDSIGYQFRNVDLLVQAFTRRSYSRENGGIDNEILEFVGDRALDIAVVKTMSEIYGSYGAGSEDDCYLCDFDEGDLSDNKSKIVQKRNLAHCIDQLELAKYLRMGHGDIRNRINENESVKEDLFEAIIGAVTLDSDWNLAIIQQVVNNMLNLDSDLYDYGDYENYIGMVQDWAVEDGGDRPSYHIVSNCGFYTGNIFHIYSKYTNRQGRLQCKLEIPRLKVIFWGYGDNEREAKYDAAHEAYDYIVNNGLLKTIINEIENPNMDDSINQLEILSRRGYFSLPVYTYDESHDDDGNPIWTVECMIEEIDGSFVGVASSKKTAKKQAAYKMLLHVLKD